MLPCNCPSCGSRLTVKALKCENCETEVTGRYTFPVLAVLSPDEQMFVQRFVKHSGSLKQMSAEMKLSYPTVRNILNEVISKIESYESELENSV